MNGCRKNAPTLKSEFERKPAKHTPKEDAKHAKHATNAQNAQNAQNGV